GSVVPAGGGAGCREAQFNLALMYETGAGVPQDHAAAAAGCRRAAGQGEADAQYGLACMAEEGSGVPRDDTAAWFWHSLSAAQGDAEAAAGRDRTAARLTADPLA
ncbi:MAG: sel1 repeat family protein, partial [Acidobacteria bacterium]|nr:sel1 repeat family protein [Acidobacteriota bacterium]